MRRLVLLLLACLAVLAPGPAGAQATRSVDDVVRELESDPVYVDGGAGIPLDADRVRDALRSASTTTYVAVVPAAVVEDAGGIASFVTQVGSDLPNPGSSVVLAVYPQPNGRPFFRADNGQDLGGVNAGQAIEEVLDSTPRGEVTEGVITGIVLDFVERVDAQASGEGSGSGGAPAGLGWLLGAGAVGGGGYLLLRNRKRKIKHGKDLEDARADVESLYGRLGSDVQTLAPGDDEIARHALSDAAERYNATGALMAKADTLGEYAAARRTAAEGLAATRVVRARLGLDPGPDVPLPPGQAPQLAAPARVQVGEEEYDGSPEYEPGRPHYYEGGYYGGQTIPGGWYATPFWQTLILSSVLNRGYGRRGHYRGGVFGGGVGGGGFSGRGGGGGRRGGGF